LARILLIDDDAVYSDMAKQRLERAGHEVTVHLGPFGATAAAKRPQFDLIILDVFMPALQGPDLIELIRQSKPKVRPKMMFCSSMDEDPLRELAVRHQADGYVSKSASRHDFLSAVEAVLERSFYRRPGNQGETSG
jgi:two-component system response regulator MprA